MIGHDIRPHTPVFGACGLRIGTVDRVEGFAIKMLRDVPAATAKLAASRWNGLNPSKQTCASTGRARKCSRNGTAWSAPRSVHESPTDRAKARRQT
jgi:hypothetical protein